MKRRNHERFEIHTNRKGLPDPQSETGTVHPDAGAAGGGLGICLYNSVGWFYAFDFFVRGGSMEDKRIEELYKLLKRAGEEKDYDAVSALRWAIFTLENQ